MAIIRPQQTRLPSNRTPGIATVSMPPRGMRIETHRAPAPGEPGSVHNPKVVSREQAKTEMPAEAATVGDPALQEYIDTNNGEIAMGVELLHGQDDGSDEWGSHFEAAAQQAHAEDLASPEVASDRGLSPHAARVYAKFPELAPENANPEGDPDKALSDVRSALQTMSY